MIYSDMMATCQSKNHVILIKSDFITNQIKSSIIGAVSWPLSNFFNLGCYMPIQGRCGLCEPYIMLCDLICISLACWTWSNHLSDSSPPPWDWILLKGTLHLSILITKYKLGLIGGMVLLLVSVRKWRGIGKVILVVILLSFLLVIAINYVSNQLYKTWQCCTGYPIHKFHHLHSHYSSGC